MILAQKEQQGGGKEERERKEALDFGVRLGRFGSLPLSDHGPRSSEETDRESTRGDLEAMRVSDTHSQDQGGHHEHCASSVEGNRVLDVSRIDLDCRDERRVFCA